MAWRSLHGYFIDWPPCFAKSWPSRFHDISWKKSLQWSLFDEEVIQLRLWSTTERCLKFESKTHIIYMACQVACAAGADAMTEDEIAVQSKARVQEYHYVSATPVWIRHVVTKSATLSYLCIILGDGPASQHLQPPAALPRWSYATIILPWIMTSKQNWRIRPCHRRPSLVDRPYGCISQPNRLHVRSQVWRTYPRSNGYTQMSSYWLEVLHTSLIDRLPPRRHLRFSGAHSGAPTPTGQPAMHSARKAG
jgi:hypothetical protein